MNVLEAITMRRSVRSYLPKPIPDDVMQRMRNALRFAPSACNKQPWRFVLVDDPKLRADVAAVEEDRGLRHARAHRLQFGIELLRDMFRH